MYGNSKPTTYKSLLDHEDAIFHVRIQLWRRNRRNRKNKIGLDEALKVWVTQTSPSTHPPLATRNAECSSVIESRRKRLRRISRMVSGTSLSRLTNSERYDIN